jgi:vacuolar protein-sorting-associated protein 4
MTDFLPNAHARIEAFRFELGDRASHSLTPQDFCEIAELTNGYSINDIYLVVREFLMQPVRKIQAATHYKLVCFANLMFLV